MTNSLFYDVILQTKSANGNLFLMSNKFKIIRLITFSILSFNIHSIQNFIWFPSRSTHAACVFAMLKITLELLFTGNYEYIIGVNRINCHISYTNKSIRSYIYCREDEITTSYQDCITENHFFWMEEY